MGRDAFAGWEEKPGPERALHMKIQSIQISECNRTRALAGAYLGGELLTETSLALERHMAGCSPCRQCMCEMDRIRKLVRAAVRRVTVPRRMKDRILARIAEWA